MSDLDRQLQDIFSVTDNNDARLRKAADGAAEKFDTASGRKGFNFRGAFNSAAQPKWRYGSVSSTNNNIVQ